MTCPQQSYWLWHSEKKIEWLELWSILCSMAQWSSSYYFGPCSIRFNHYEEIISTYLLGVQNVHFYTFSLWLKISGVFMCLGADKRQCVYGAVFMQRFLTLIIYKSAVWISKDQQKILILSPFLSFAQPPPPPPYPFSLSLSQPFHLHSHTFSHLLTLSDIKLVCRVDKGAVRWAEPIHSLSVFSTVTFPNKDTCVHLNGQQCGKTYFV